MSTPTLTRAQVVGAVEAGILNAPAMPVAAATALRAVATTVSTVGVGQFGSLSDACIGCPMTLAYLTTCQGDLTPVAKAIGLTGEQLSLFTARFDTTIDRFIVANVEDLFDAPTDYDVVQVVG